MRIDIVTKEFPPEIYGGAGVHVAELSRVLAQHVDLQVRAFGAPREPGYHGATVTSYAVPEDLAGANAAVQTLGVDLRIVPGHRRRGPGAFAHLVRQHGRAHRLAAARHSRMCSAPTAWSRCARGRPSSSAAATPLSSWVEKTAYEAAAAIIAVSEGMRQDILRSYPEVDPAKVKVVHNGIDVSLWNRDEGDDVVRALGIDPARPSVVFVGRNTRQKGVPYLLRAAAKLPADVQLVLCLGAADTPELAAETARLIEELQTQRGGVILVERMLPRNELIQVLSHATAFACPSIYEPLGIVNLEAMACGAAVVASATGGIPEVVQHGETGLLVDIEQVTDGTGTPLDPEKFVTEFAAALTEVVSDPERARAMGQAGRRRAEEHFSWESITETTLEVYRSVLPKGS